MNIRLIIRNYKILYPISSNYIMYYEHIEITFFYHAYYSISDKMEYIFFFINAFTFGYYDLTDVLDRSLRPSSSFMLWALAMVTCHLTSCGKCKYESFSIQLQYSSKHPTHAIIIQKSTRALTKSILMNK